MRVPKTIKESLAEYKKDHADQTTCFVVMQFGEQALAKKSPVTDEPKSEKTRVLEVIKSTLDKFSITALRADEKWYHQDLLQNVETYIFGCNFAIAIFEGFVENQFNPNVSFEIGYLLALQKPIFILKDKSLPKTLPADIIGKLYHEFDSSNPEETIPGNLVQWLRDKKLIREEEPVEEEIRKKVKYKLLHPEPAYITMEKRIEERLILGKSNKAIADELGISISRVYDERKFLEARGVLKRK